MELLMIRHGLPERVETNDGTPADPPLSVTGHDQARRVADWLADVEIDAVYASPLRRARETAAPLASKLGVEIDLEPGVREYDAESDLYIPMEELKATDYERWREMVSGGYAPEFDFAVFYRTVVSAVEQIISANAGKRVAVFCHGGVINAWAAHVLKLPPQLFIDATYTSVNRFMAAGSGERSLVSLNEAGHLRDMPAIGSALSRRG
jgi:probable phosphoglycerate mutase